jgi:hypothetical protein
MVLRMFFSIVAFAALLSSGCFDNADKAPKASSRAIGEVELFTFSTHQRDFLGTAQPLVVPPSTSIRDALDALGRELATNYFAKTYTGKATDIHFEVLRVGEIATPSRALRIGVVNMVDKEQDAVKYFFQGSAGGQTTFYMITATFMQPHLSPPLLDGLVLLYNAKILPELDHINLTGVLTPRSARHVTERAIQRAKGKVVVSNDGWTAFPKLIS